MLCPQLTFHSLSLRAVHVPLSPPVQTASGAVTVAPLVLLDLRTAEGIIGSSYIFCYTPLVLKPVVQLLRELEALLKGGAVAPLTIEKQLQQRFRLLGPGFSRNGVGRH